MPLTETVPLSKRLECFIHLGKFLRTLPYQEKAFLASQARMENPWFTEQNVLIALQNLAIMLEEEEVVNFVLHYPWLGENRPSETIGIVSAGNIPAVGFHDLFCVLIAGHRIQLKPSKSDSVLIKFLVHKIMELEPAFAERIQLVDRLVGFDRVICTGSDNSARYFEHYFGKYPHIIRKNRTSVAVLSGQENSSDLHSLAEDIFTYYGFGCRNVSKLFLPKGYEIARFLEAMEPFSYTIQHHKYANNYDYNKAIFIVNGQPYYDNGFLLLKESSSLFSPLSVLYFEYYETLEEARRLLEKSQQDLQCVVSKINVIPKRIDFGTTQCPKLIDYADGVDTIAFLGS